MRDTHPFIAFSYFVAVISLTMCATQPIVVALSLTVALAYQLILKGFRATLRVFGLSVAIVLIVTVFNMVFVNQGFTVIFYILSNPVTLEAAIYGLSLGLMLAAVLMWFFCYQVVVGSDRFLALFSWAVPTTAMMVSMIFSYIPQVQQKARQIDDAHKALAYVDKPGSEAPATESTDASSTTLNSEEIDIIDTTDASSTTLNSEELDIVDTTVDAGVFGKIEPSSGPEWISPPANKKHVPFLERLRWPVRLSSLL
ncbi:MAG: energy-coupling factor transporter transmembrane protein EcfT, partial [Coriobacteriales bacterium]|nr:energy-coupling factor transporter transmembrane protein EcfT [Coriobacteriales bacterium]